MKYGHFLFTLLIIVIMFFLLMVGGGGLVLCVFCWVVVVGQLQKFLWRAESPLRVRSPCYTRGVSEVVREDQHKVHPGRRVFVVCLCGLPLRFGVWFLVPKKKWNTPLFCQWFFKGTPKIVDSSSIPLNNHKHGGPQKHTHAFLSQSESLAAMPHASNFLAAPSSWREE